MTAQNPAFNQLAVWMASIAATPKKRRKMVKLEAGFIVFMDKRSFIVAIPGLILVRKP
jgi:hypothetical protein